MSESPQNREVDGYAEIEAEVDRQFAGEWPRFLRALENVADVLEVVLHHHCGGERERFEAWCGEKGVPDEWQTRFYIAMANKGRPLAGTSSPSR